ncbi:uncharacterized protein LOC120535173 isoform X1 [Polypterus senegalus]|uniref:uncharacterized protein LOC120535173 isoform X1 n=1 Tax=Polypterus senegalus TaxID=55291 RepID=UPI001963AC10|nr:uncharacterized protein LOC120535173 isoform X1 [Polypterus senegalus]
MAEQDQNEVLGEKLYSVIYPKHPAMAGKLTGMLLELPTTLVQQMIQDENILLAGLEKALGALDMPASCSIADPEYEDDCFESRDLLGEKLYGLIDGYNTGYSEKITGGLKVEKDKLIVIAYTTLLAWRLIFFNWKNPKPTCYKSMGMLLEQKKEEVKKLILDPRLLQEKVQIALTALEEGMAEHLSSKTEVKESLGEKLFAMIKDIDSVNCASITGMLLEMEPTALQRLQQDRMALKSAVQKAQAALLLNCSSNSGDSVHIDEEKNIDSEMEKLGEELYAYVINTEFEKYAEKITGMLLELPKPDIISLLNSPETLQEKLQEAAEVLQGCEWG